MTSPLREHLSQIAEYSTPRATFLYSSIASRKTANPTGYASAIQWWRSTLASVVAKGLLGPDHLILVADESLRENLRWERIGRPASLGPILAELTQSGDFVPLDAFLDPSEPASASWLSVLSRPLWWSLSQLRTTVIGGSAEGGVGTEEAEWTRRMGDYVVVELVERAAMALIPQLANLHVDAISRLYTIPMFHTAVGSLCLPGVTLSERDCTVLARHLSSKKLCIVDGNVVKFAAPLATALPSPISEADRGILALRTSLSNLECYITSIETRIAEQQALVVSYHAKKQLALVKSHIVSRKRLETLLADRVGSRDKVSEILMGIERAVGSEETMAALTLGTSTLRTLISSPTLSLEHIEATTTAFADALADADDINQAIEAGSVALPSDQEDDVESELKEMVAAAELEERKEKEAEEMRKKQAAEEERRKKVAEEKRKEEESGEGIVKEQETRREREREASAAALLGSAATPPSATPVERETARKDALPAQ
ncbi:hypothetical protein RQP46_000765 [Phenoliferia psychrophenolica]